MNVNFLDQGGVDLLSAAIVKKAYEDLIDARIYDAMMMFHEISYNCNIIYERELKSKGDVELYKDWALAKRQIEKGEKWFMESERCRMLLKRAKGEWFVEVAKERMKLFALDRIMRNDLAVSIGHDAEALRRRERNLKIWREKRDEWRKANKLSEVREDGEG